MSLLVLNIFHTSNSKVSIVNFEHVIAGWDCAMFLQWETDINVASGVAEVSMLGILGN